MTGELKGTLTKQPHLVETGDRMNDLNTNIKSLSSKFNPDSITAFNSVMQNISSLAYKKRQTQEHKQLDKEFDPTKVSGSTFAGIMNYVEKNRGADITKIADSSMSAYSSQQKQIGSMLKQLTTDRDRLKQNAQQFQFEMSAKYPGLYGTLSSDERKSISNGEPSESVFAKFDKYTLAQKQKDDAWEAEQRSMKRISYQRTTKDNSLDKEINAKIMKDAEEIRGNALASHIDPDWRNQLIREKIEENLELFGSKFEKRVSVYDLFRDPIQKPITLAEKKYEQEMRDRDTMVMNLMNEKGLDYPTALQRVNLINK